MGLPVIKTSGTGFIKSGERWQIKGVTYSGYEDVKTLRDALTDADQCAIDAPLLKKLGANTITVYYIDPSKNHDDCMQSFEDNGIYVLATLPDMNATTSNEGWDMTQYTRFTKVVDAFAGYNNLLGFFVGIESINYNDSDKDDENTLAPSLKAAVRDMKAYSAAKQYRTIPFGYSTDDDAQIRLQVAEYLVCGGNSSEAIDFFGLNLYAWCGDATYASSGYKDTYSEFGVLGVPIFLSEDGCNAVQPREFKDQSALFGSEMSGNWSGAVIYEWRESGNDYGLVNFTKLASGAQTPQLLSDYTSLSKEWASCTINTTSPITKPTPACPTSNSLYWTLDPSVTLPTIAGLNIATVKVASATPTSTSDSDSDSGSVQTTNTSESSSGLSSGAKAGIGIGVAAGVILIALSAWFFFYRRRKQKATSAGKQSPAAELAGPEASQLHGTPVGELPGSGNITEMSGGSGIHPQELQASERHELEDSSSHEAASTQISPSDAGQSSSSAVPAGEHVPRDTRASLLGPFQPEIEGPPLNSSQRSVSDT
ncbi:hypothetical protein N7478_004417 [Penicillium angulare]|uniref:uncharacterized protein n=1 Tax=Penicillium angulare TaxID=116970 RepID=UPI002541A07A|nr:uncharacterized protein N7478_004417 [Penicillium angulare]KAJ5279045.1 hypothetical protein N7478_004417 [Penicillium angulare]